MTHPKNVQHTDEDYVAWVKERPCFVCGISGIDCHHLHNAGKPGKRNDFLGFPLCRRHHTEIHTIGHYTFAERYNVDFDHEVINLLSEYIKSAQN